MSLKTAILLFFVFLLASCGIVKQSSKTAFTDGFYKQQKNHQQQIVYVQVTDDELKVYTIKTENGKRVVDNNTAVETVQTEIPETKNSLRTLSKNSFDLDFLTIPLKYRPGRLNVPSQLNSNLNGAAFIGFRTDRYHVSYKTNPFGRSIRDVNHFGISFGLFTGIGNTFMSPTTTNNLLQQEYDGIVWGKGIAGIIAVNRFTVGLSIGFDNLLDKNRKSWIYESKPWLGLAFGLNLN